MRKKQHPPGEEVRRVSFWPTGNREEENASRIRQGLGGGKPRRNSLEGLASDEGDVAAIDTEIVQLPVGEAAQLIHGFPVAAPVAVIADQVHCSARFFVFVFDQRRYGAEISGLRGFLK